MLCCVYSEREALSYWDRVLQITDLEELPLYFADTDVKIPLLLLMQLKEYTDDTQDLINIKLVRHDLCLQILCSIFPHSFEFLNIYTNVLCTLIGKCSEPAHTISVASYCCALCGYNICFCHSSIWNEF